MDIYELLQQELQAEEKTLRIRRTALILSDTDVMRFNNRVGAKLLEDQMVLNQSCILAARYCCNR